MRTSPYRLMSGSFFRAYVITMRPYLLFVSGISGIAGMSLAPEISGNKALCIALASFLSYGFGQALTDCFQVDTDSISAPYRPLTQGRISRIQVLAVSLTGLLFCIAVLAFFNPANLGLGLLAGLGLATYTPFKRRWWGGPFYNAWIVTLLFLMGYLAGTGPAPIRLPAGFVPAALTVFFGYANFVLAGYFKDVIADAQTGYRTIPVTFGRSTGAWVSDAFGALGALSALTGLVLVAQSTMASRAAPAPLASADVLIPGLLVAAGCGASLGAQMLLHAVMRDEEAHPAIALVVHSYLLLLGGLAVLQKPAWMVPILLFYGGFVLVLSMRPAKSQI